VISVRRFSLVMISEDSLDWMSLSVIWSVFCFLGSMGSWWMRFFADSILVFIWVRVAIILLYVSCYSAENSYSYYLGGSSGYAA
jgi:hypothetical protein